MDVIKNTFYPLGLNIICTILVIVIPYTWYKVTAKLHEIGDPPWKKENPNGQ